MCTVLKIKHSFKKKRGLILIETKNGEENYVLYFFK